MQAVNKREFILTGNLRKVIWTVSLPLMLNNLIQTVYNLTDSMFITRIDPLAMGAVSFLFPLIQINIAFCIAFSSAGMSLIAQYIGAGKPKRARQTAAQLVILAFFICIGVLAFSYLFGPKLASLMGLEGIMYEYGMDYFLVVLLEVPFMFIMNIYNAIRQGQGDTVSPMVYTVASVALNIALDPLFMFVFGWGVRGAAIATVLSRALVCIPEVFTVMTARQGIRLVPASIKIDKPIMKNLASIGIPATIGETITSFGFLLLNFFIISYGDNTITAFAIGNRLLNIIMMPIMGLGSGLAIIIGQHLGAQNVPRAKKAVKECMISGSVIMFLGGLLLVATAKWTVGFFAGENAEIFSQAVTYINYLGYTNVFLAIFQNFLGIFQGSGQSKTIMFLSLARLWLIRIPMILLLGKITSLGETSIWISMSFSNLIIIFICYFIYKKGKWEKGKISEDTERMVEQESGRSKEGGSNE